MKGIIIYTTKYGCTEKAVKLLQSKMPEEIPAFNAAKGKVPDLSLYDTVILGGPIYAGKMQKELAGYMQQNLDALKGKKLALFICAGEQDPAQIENLLAAAFPEELSKCAFMKEDFGGELRLEKVGLAMKLILRIFIGIKEDYSRLSEAKIDRFAKGILGVRV